MLEGEPICSLLAVSSPHLRPRLWLLLRNSIWIVMDWYNKPLELFIVKYKEPRCISVD
jgi:hypothetical protein